MIHRTPKTVRLGICHAGLLAGILGSLPLHAQSPLDVDQVRFLGSADLGIDFSDDGSGLLEDFAVEMLLPDGSWEPVPTASFQSLGGSAWRATVPHDPSRPTALFRITRDGEPITGAFSAPSSTVVEGENGGALVQFSGLFSGTLLYTVDPGGDTTPQSGSIQVNGATSVVIPITLPDDAEVGTLRALTINLDGGDLLLGTLTTSHVTVADNDSEWAGVLISDGDGVTTQVELKVIQTNASRTVTLTAEAGGVFPSGGNLGTAALTLDGDGLSGSVNGIVIPGADTLYGADTELTLAFNGGGGGTVLEEPTDEEVQLGETQVIRGYEGTFSLTSTVPTLTHLSIPERTGSFIIYRKPPLAPVAFPTTPVE
jgi:hypothetical protein